jgi:hypothetical protein
VQALLCAQRIDGFDLPPLAANSQGQGVKRDSTTMTSTTTAGEASSAGGELQSWHVVFA